SFSYFEDSECGKGVASKPLDEWPNRQLFCQRLDVRPKQLGPRAFSFRCPGEELVARLERRVGSAASRGRRQVKRSWSSAAGLEERVAAENQKDNREADKRRR